MSDPEEDGCDPEEDGCDPEEDAAHPARRSPTRRARVSRESSLATVNFPLSRRTTRRSKTKKKKKKTTKTKRMLWWRFPPTRRWRTRDPRALRSPLWRRRTKKTTMRVEAPAEEEEEEDDDDEMWYVGGTQAFPDAPPGDSEEDADEDDAAAADDDDAPLPPMDDDDDDDGRLNEATGVVRSNQTWTGPLPEIGCPKCRFAAKGCGRCRAIRAHAEFGTPLPWGGTVRVGTNVRGRGRARARPPRRLDRRLQRNARVDPHRRRPFAAFVSTTTRPAGDSRPSSPRPPGNADASSPPRRVLRGNDAVVRRHSKKKRPVAVSMTFPRRPPCFLG